MDWIMKLFGYENIKNIKIPKCFAVPSASKMRNKANFYNATGIYQDKVVINNKGLLLDGYITYLFEKWRKDRKYIKVIRIDCNLAEYENLYKSNRLRSRRK